MFCVFSDNAPLNNPENNCPINLQCNGALCPTYAPLQTWLQPSLCVQKTEVPAPLCALETEVQAPLCSLEAKAPAPLFTIETEAPATLRALETKVSAPLCHLNETDLYNIHVTGPSGPSFQPLETGISVPSIQLLETGISALSHDPLRSHNDIICSYIHGEEKTNEFQVIDQNQVHEYDHQDFRNSISSLETYLSSNFAGNN